jgi:hypothetical protein
MLHQDSIHEPDLKIAFGSEEQSKCLKLELPLDRHWSGVMLQVRQDFGAEHVLHNICSFTALDHTVSA